MGIAPGGVVETGAGRSRSCTVVRNDPPRLFTQHWHCALALRRVGGIQQKQKSGTMDMSSLRTTTSVGECGVALPELSNRKDAGDRFLRKSQGGRACVDRAQSRHRDSQQKEDNLYGHGRERLVAACCGVTCSLQPGLQPEIRHVKQLCNIVNLNFSIQRRDVRMSRNQDFLAVVLYRGQSNSTGPCQAHAFAELAMWPAPELTKATFSVAEQACAACGQP